MHVCIHTYVHTYVQTCMHTYSVAQHSPQHSTPVALTLPLVAQHSTPAHYPKDLPNTLSLLPRVPSHSCLASQWIRLAKPMHRSVTARARELLTREKAGQNGRRAIQQLTCHSLIEGLRRSERLRLCLIHVAIIRPVPVHVRQVQATDQTWALLVVCNTNQPVFH